MYVNRVSLAVKHSTTTEKKEFGMVQCTRTHCTATNGSMLVRIKNPDVQWPDVEAGPPSRDPVYLDPHIVKKIEQNIPKRARIHEYTSSRIFFDDDTITAETTDGSCRETVTVVREKDPWPDVDAVLARDISVEWSTVTLSRANLEILCAVLKGAGFDRVTLHVPHDSKTIKPVYIEADGDTEQPIEGVIMPVVV